MESPASVLGGYNLGISTYSKNRVAALSFINFATGPAAQVFFIKSSLPAVPTQTYKDPAVDRVPAVRRGCSRQFRTECRDRCRRCIRRSARAIYKNVYSALSNGTAPSTALKNAQSQINSALKTF